MKMENDSLVLGRIKEIHKHRLIISLPHNKTGVCPISAISEEYNSYLKRLVDDDSILNDVAELKRLFIIGQLVQVKLIKSINNNKFDLTLLPSAINSNINVKCMKKCMKMQVAIKSREDKGYILETGISGLNGFLPFDKCSDANFEIGQLVEVFPILKSHVKSDNSSRVINFKTNSSSKAAIISPTECKFDSILPGMLIKATMKTSKTGSLEGKFNGFPVSVHPDHHRNTESVSDEQTLCVIGIDCALKQLDCSVLLHLQPPFKGSDDLLAIQIGHSEKNCIIKKLEKGNLTLDIPNLKFATGVVLKAHIESNLSESSVGDRVTARFMDYNLVDNVVIATTLAKLLSQSYFSVHQAKLGEIVKGTVCKRNEHGFRVQISSQLSGLLPTTHLSDRVPGRTGKATPKPGDVIKCRVFHVDTAENQLILTLRKSLMNSTLPVVSGFSDLHIDLVLSGFVVKILEFGLVVVLFGNLRGWIPISRIPASMQKSLAVSFHVGKPVEVKVVRWDESKNKIELSLNGVETEENGDGQTSVGVGDVYEAVIKQTKPDGFIVKLLRTNRSAFLPFTQLSDSREHRSLLQAHFTATGNGSLPAVVVINTNSNNITVSKKHSLISAAELEQLVTNASSVTVGTQWIGWITKKESYGIFVELPSGVRGLVRNRDICDFKPPGTVDTADLFEIGDTVSVKVIEIDPSKGDNRCLFSVKMKDTYRAADHMDSGAIAFLRNHLTERRFLQSTTACSAVHALAIGQLVQVTLGKQCEWGYTLQLASEAEDVSVAGFVRNQHLPDSGTVSQGTLHRAVIIDIDLNEQAIEVTLSGSLINAVSNLRIDAKCARVDIGQNVVSDVLHVNSDFVVAALKGHAHGHIVYIPTKRFWNDAVREFNWIVKQRNPTVIKDVLSNNIFIGSLAINEAISAPTQPKPVITESSEIGLYKDLSNKNKFKKGKTYPAFFHSVTKTKVFVALSKRQRGICNLIEFSNSLEDVEKLITHPPEQYSPLAKLFKVTGQNKDTGMVSGHFLDKSELEVGDVICCHVASAFSKMKYKLKLPFDHVGYVNFGSDDEDDHNTRRTSVMPRVGSIAQFRVAKISDKKFIMSTVDSRGLSVDDDGDEVVHKREEHSGEESANEEDEEMDTEDDGDEMKMEDDEEMPMIVLRKAKSGLPEGKENLSNIYKRIHNSDTEEDEEEGSQKEDEDSCQQKPAAKRAKIDTVERELSIRRAEKRRETGDNMKNPTTAAEYEMLLFNRPNESNSWTRYMRFLLDVEKSVDKARAIAERAMKTVPVRDSDNRFRIMKDYMDLEIDQLVLSANGPNHDGQLVRVRKLLERGLSQKAKAFYLHVCDKLMGADHQLELAEEIAKRFIRDFHYDSAAWYQLFLVRFVQKKFPVVKETLTNAERALKVADFRELMVRVAQAEIERADTDRGVQMLVELVQKRPKDGSLRNRVVAILQKHDLSQHIAKLDSLTSA